MVYTHLRFLWKTFPGPQLPVRSISPQISRLVYHSAQRLPSTYNPLPCCPQCLAPQAVDTFFLSWILPYTGVSPLRPRTHSPLKKSQLETKLKAFGCTLSKTGKPRQSSLWKWTSTFLLCSLRTFRLRPAGAERLLPSLWTGLPLATHLIDGVPPQVSSCECPF